MLWKQERMEVDPANESVMKRVLVVLNHFENRFEPNPFMTCRILGHLDIKTRGEYTKRLNCWRMRFAPDTWTATSLLEDYDVGLIELSEGRGKNLEVLNCLNPEDFRCPISMELMTNPLTVSTGRTYDGVSIHKWLKSGNFVCPKTGEKLKNAELVPNTSLKKLIHELCVEYAIPLLQIKDTET